MVCVLLSVPSVRATCVLEYLGYRGRIGVLRPPDQTDPSCLFKVLLDNGTPESSILRSNSSREPFLEQPNVLGTDAAAAADEPRAHV